MPRGCRGSRGRGRALGAGDALRELGKRAKPLWGSTSQRGVFQRGKHGYCLVLPLSSFEDSLKPVAFLSFPLAVAGSGMLLQQMQPGMCSHSVENRARAPARVPAGNSRGCRCSVVTSPGCCGLLGCSELRVLLRGFAWLQLCSIAWRAAASPGLRGRRRCLAGPSWTLLRGRPRCLPPLQPLPVQDPLPAGDTE